MTGSGWGEVEPEPTDVEPWMADALCTEVDPDAFFPEKGGSTKEARAVCAECPVQAECLAYALRNDERYGIWGGLSERERKKLRAPSGARPGGASEEDRVRIRALTAEGRTDAQIAGRLGLRTHQVRYQRDELGLAKRVKGDAS